METLPSSPDQISEETRQKIIRMLISGEFPVDSAIARACNVKPSVITRMLAKDPQLAEYRMDAEREIAQNIERSAIELAMSARNEMARQKGQEFLLKKMMPEKYGDNASFSSSGSGAKKIIVAPVLPVMKVNADGMPIEEAKSESPLNG